MERHAEKPSFAARYNRTADINKYIDVALRDVLIVIEYVNDPGLCNGEPARVVSRRLHQSDR
jgi:hypothetical protein